MKAFQIFLFSAVLLIAFSPSCSKDKDCEGTCLNGGVCEDGNCNCPDGYEGPNCAEQETPLKMFIHSVRVTRFPALDGGTNWDLLDGPDIFFQLFAGSTLIYEQPNFIEDADPSVDLILTVTTPIEITNTTGEHGIQLLDYDDGITDDDFMGGILFTPYFSNTNGFPTTLNLDAGGAVAFTLEVSYLW